MSIPKNPLDRMSRVDGSMHLNQGLRDAYDASKRQQESMKRSQESLKQLQDSMKRSQAALQAQDAARRAAQQNLDRPNQPQNLNADGNLDTGANVGTGTRVFRALFMCAVAGFFLFVAYHLFLHR